MPRLSAGPFRYRRHADAYLETAMRYTRTLLKQAVISPSALSLMYPADPLPGYTRDEFVGDLLREHETEVRNCLDKGAHAVQIDFTEGRLAMKLDRSGELLTRAEQALTLIERERPHVLVSDVGSRTSTATSSCAGCARSATPPEARYLRSR